MLIPEQLIPQIEVDSPLVFKNIDDKFFRILKQFEPFGPDNMRPVFHTQNVMDTGYGKLVGIDQKHIKLTLFDQSSKAKHNAVGFNLSHHFPIVKSRKTFDICYTVEENHFRGNVSLQLSLKDLKEHH